MVRCSDGLFSNARINMVGLERLFFISLCLTHIALNCVFVFRLTSQGGIRCCAITLFTTLSLFSFNFCFAGNPSLSGSILCLFGYTRKCYNHIPAGFVASPSLLHQQAYLGSARCLALLDLALGLRLYTRGHASLFVSYSLLSLYLNTRVPVSP